MVGQHTSRQYDVELDSVRARVMQMGALVETQVSNAMHALIAGDAPMMNAIVDNDHLVDALDSEIDEACTRIIARRQPTAIDLRELITLVRISSELERIGDNAKKIARLGLLLWSRRPFYLPRYTELEYATALAIDMLRKSLDAYSRLDLNLSAETIAQDRLVNQEFQAIMRYLVSYMMEDPRTISAALEIVFVAKSVERIGDHAKNIAEHLVYLVKGRNMRHAQLEEIEHTIRDTP